MNRSGTGNKRSRSRWALAREAAKRPRLSLPEPGAYAYTVTVTDTANGDTATWQGNMPVGGESRIHRQPGANIELTRRLAPGCGLASETRH
jgi:hypothetical protein